MPSPPHPMLWNEFFFSWKLTHLGTSGVRVSRFEYQPQLPIATYLRQASYHSRVLLFLLNGDNHSVPLDSREIDQSIWKEINPEYHWKDWCWNWNSNTLVTSCEELIHWKRPWCWERFKAGREGDHRRWDGWVASPTQWTGFEQTPQDSEGQGRQACPWGFQESENT